MPKYCVLYILCMILAVPGRKNLKLPQTLLFSLECSDNPLISSKRLLTWDCLEHFEWPSVLAG